MKTIGTQPIGPDRRFSRVWFGAGADLKCKAFRVAKEFARKRG